MYLAILSLALFVPMSLLLTFHQQVLSRNYRCKMGRSRSKQCRLIVSESGLLRISIIDTEYLHCLFAGNSAPRRLHTFLPCRAVKPLQPLSPIAKPYANPICTARPGSLWPFIWACTTARKDICFGRDSESHCGRLIKSEKSSIVWVRYVTHASGCCDSLHRRD